MAGSDQRQAKADPTQAKFETAIAAAAPLLDLILAAGERISRIAEPVDYEYYPVRDETEDPDLGDPVGSPPEKP